MLQSIRIWWLHPHFQDIAARDPAWPVSMCVAFWLEMEGVGVPLWVVATLAFYLLVVCLQSGRCLTGVLQGFWGLKGSGGGGSYPTLSALSVGVELGVSFLHSPAGLFSIWTPLDTTVSESEAVQIGCLPSHAAYGCLLVLVTLKLFAMFVFLLCTCSVWYTWF